MNDYNYNTKQQLFKKLKNSNLNIVEFIIKREMTLFGAEKKQLIFKLKSYIKTMRKSIDEGLKGKNKTICLNNEAARLYRYKQRLLSDFEYEVIYSSIAIAEHNCSMGKIIACPTAGSCGILPGVLIPLGIRKNISDLKLVYALIIAGEVGRIIANKTSISGAVGGCMVECGIASAMTAAAVTYLMGGDEEKIFNAATLALKNNMGLICDPVAGMVEVPCVKRNGLKAIESLAAAQLSLSGVKSVIPFDEVVDSIKEIAGNMDGKYKETATGGLAVTPTGYKYKKILIKRKS